MSRKRLMLLGLLALSIGAGVAITLALLPTRPGVSKANFDRIEVGMTMAEVEALLGESPNVMDIEYNDGRSERLAEWQCYAGRMTISIDKNGRVSSTECGEGWPDNRTPWQKIVALATGRDDPPDIDLALPAPNYLRHQPKFFPPSPPYPLPKELNSLEEAQRKFDEDE